jgi:mRNA-degrading endonuclease RelE of RelBE toxin-antitoxin system
MVNDQNNKTSGLLVDQIIEKVKGLTEDQQQYILRQLQKFEFLDRREFQRFRCDNFVIGFDVDGTQSRKIVLDISEGGLFVKSETVLPAGQKVVLTFADIDGRAQYRVNSTVVRTVNNGIALVFDADNQQQRLKIKAIMHYVRHVGYVIDE